MKDREHLFDDREALARKLADTIAAELEEAIRIRGEASLVVSGGSTPKPLFEALSGRALDWSKVRVTLADERWVPADHEASNERLVRNGLLVGEAAGAQFVSLVNDAPSPEEGQAVCEAAVQEIPRPFDVVVLGMGGDGHTASLFPGVPELTQGLDPESPRDCLAVRPTTAPHPRMSLTLAALCDSRSVVLHITGEEKWNVYQTALGDGPVEELPIRAVLRSGHPGLRVYWAS